jgi:hypothetical protein
LLLDQWRAENMHCVALSYTPLPERLRAVVERGGWGAKSNSGGGGGGGVVGGPGSPGGGGGGGSGGGGSGGGGPSGGGPGGQTPRSPLQTQQRPSIRPLAGFDADAPYLVVEGVHLPEFLVTPDADVSCASGATPAGGSSSAISKAAESAAQAALATARGVEPASPGMEPAGGGGGGGGGGGTKGGQGSAIAADHHNEHPLWSLQNNQIFLGMVAACVNPKPQTVRFIEDLDAAGVRFVHFSAQSMRRSKLLAEKMGIETDWNCAISLRDLADAAVPDPHRMKSAKYADWTVQARLPSGVRGIRTHLDNVDDVPLLVSLYSDSTPSSVRQMIEVFQEQHEVVLVIGSTLKCANVRLFAQADCSIGLDDTMIRQRGSSGYGGGGYGGAAAATPSAASAAAATHSPVSAAAAAAAATTDRDDPKADPDLGFASALQSIPCALTVHGEQGLPIVLRLLVEGRRLLYNLWQLFVFLLTAHALLALVLLGGRAIALERAPALGGGTLLWLVWVAVPLLALPLLATPGDAGIMSIVPSKADDGRVGLHRGLGFVAALALPCAALCLLVHEWCLGALACAAHGGRSDAGDWASCVTTAATPATAPALELAAARAEGAMAFALLLMLVALALCSQQRSTSIFVEPVWHNRAALAFIAIAIGLQVRARRALGAPSPAAHLILLLRSTFTQRRLAHHPCIARPAAGCSLTRCCAPPHRRCSASAGRAMAPPMRSRARLLRAILVAIYQQG